MQAVEISQECSSPSCAALTWRINLNPLFSRIYCPAHCKDEPSYWAPVFGTNVYTDVSTNLSPPCRDSPGPELGSHWGLGQKFKLSCGYSMWGWATGGERWGEQVWRTLFALQLWFILKDLDVSLHSSLGCGQWVWWALLLSSSESFLEIWACPLTSPSLVGFSCEILIALVYLSNTFWDLQMSTKRLLFHTITL